MLSQRHSPRGLSEHGGAAVADTGVDSGRDVPEAILDATRASVLAVGVRRTTLTDVARRAGVSRMTVYRLVPDVTTLILEVMSREFARILADAEAAARRRRTGRARLAATATAVIRQLHDDPLFHRVVDVDPELLLPYLTDRLGTTQRLAIGHVRRMVAEGQRDGSVRRGEPGTIATTLVLMLTPVATSVRLLDGAGRDEVLAEVERVIDGALRP